MLTSSMMVGGGFVLAGAAVADGGTGAGATATLQDGLKFGGQIKINDGDWNAGGGLIVLKNADGTEFDTYCIDLNMETKPHAKYQETAWSGTSLATNPDAGKINWILQNSYPQVSDLHKLGSEVGVPSLDANEAAAGTQAAIWHFSDHVKAVPLDAGAATLASYLISHVQDVKEPAPSLTLSPSSVSGKSGSLLGPITVASTGNSVSASLDSTSSAAGVVLTDKSGNVLSDQSGALTKPVQNGDQLFVKAPAGANAGTATVSAKASADVQVGRAFTSLGYTPSNHSQTLILAGTQTDTVTASATATWAPTGPVLAFSAMVDCTKSGVVVTATNNGDQPFTVGVTDEGSGMPSLTVAPGQTQSEVVPVGEGAAYDIKVTGPKGQQEFQGIRNCQVAPSHSPSPSTSATPVTSATPSSSSSSPATATPSSSASASSPAVVAPSASASPTSTNGKTLAFTGGGSNSGLIAGVAGALVLLGGGAVYTMRRRGRHSRTTA
ncbi:Cys-Gln thioester bond-forming surface protein [Kitasatospora sp. NBC_01250]|uniref:Cys-Gln thioester bond-forming surface protein n=1 Tax=unclassified Kitasatospora TaxID=2633591 RepID=UPI002E13F80A|nr:MULTISPECIES: Cys-Gln thioester bond-forming surface protein [unclassified Kitasatospora]WSJ67070.1 Cys-Gln thioester bond-forming surface protein [Kitasatospora sp. NBC_01302]